MEATLIHQGTDPPRALGDEERGMGPNVKSVSLFLETVAAEREAAAWEWQEAGVPRSRVRRWWILEQFSPPGMCSDSWLLEVVSTDFDLDFAPFPFRQ